jgi:spermidine synthase
VVLERVATPGGEMVLSRRGDEVSIRIGGVELMNSRQHGSEDELGRLACERIADVAAPAILVGGLGLGYTLRAVLDAAPAARVEVVELVPAVVRWNRELVGELAGRPLDDARVRVVEGDVKDAIAASRGAWDAIVLDVDNGPDALFAGNAGLYRRRGVEAAFDALTPRGVLAVWSSFASPTFGELLGATGFELEIVTTRAHRKGGRRHTIWFGRRPALRGGR